VKRKAGLHKKISAIFDGVPVPKDNALKPLGVNEQKQSAPPAEKARKVYAQPKPQVQEKTPEKLPAQNHQQKQPVKSIHRISARKTKSSDFWRNAKIKLYGSPDGRIDKRQRNMTILVGVLSVVFAFVLIRIFGLSNKNTFNNTDALVNEKVLTPAGESEIQWNRPELYPSDLRDPMEYASSRTYGGGELVVSGVVYSDDPVAIIDGKMVREGAVIFGAKIIKINKNSVEFEDKNGKRFIIKVGKRR